MSSVLEKFLSYVKISSPSDPATLMSPSTPGQMALALVLSREMTEMGMIDVAVDDYGYVMGFLPSNTEEKTKNLGFIAHMDTSPRCNGKNIRPQIIENYKGGNIILDKEKGIILKISESPELNNYIGQTIITSDGKTLLGADDKAGIAEILTAIEYLINHPDIPHGRISVCFAPDEEIGLSTEHFDINRFEADYAYTLDGGEIGAIEYENFNAAIAYITINGKGYHPGYAKNKMLNAIIVAWDFIGKLPFSDFPEKSSGHEGYIFVDNISGDVEKATIEILIRDFDKTEIEKKKLLISDLVKDMEIKYSADIDIVIRDQYFNMKDKIQPVIFIVDLAKRAMHDVGVNSVTSPIRGGTDGSMLSHKGMPTPNLFVGYQNSHGRYEYIPLESMEKAVEVIVKLAELFTTL